MALHPFGPDDVTLIGWADGARLSPDGAQVAWTEMALDVDADRPVSGIMVAPADGSAAPRPFTQGPGDAGPRWSPDGAWLAYTASDGAGATLMLAPLGGGAPRPVDTPGPVLGAEWSPTGDRLVLVVNVAEERPTNSPRVVRGMRRHLDGRGWLDGRDHLFVHTVTDAETRQVTSGDYDHSAPSWSPDGTTLAFLSDRSARRDDRFDGADVWTVAARGGRPRRATDGLIEGGWPTWSPDGSRLAFTGHLAPEPVAGRDNHLLWVPVDRSSEPARVAPALDRPTGFSLSDRCHAWLSDDELVFSIVDRATTGIARATLSATDATIVVDGHQQVLGLDVVGTTVAYTTAWLDRPAEVRCRTLGGGGGDDRQVSRAGERLQRAVRTRSAERLSATAPDGTTIEYWAILPAGRRRDPSRPLYLDIHGGPHLYNPLPEVFTAYQALAAAGYVVVLPNPRGSIGFGEDFTSRVRGDWGGADLDDLMACVDDVLERGLADPARQYVGGYSYGGFMSSMIVGRTHRFRAACIGAPVVDLTSLFGTWDGGGYFADAMAGDPWNAADRYREHSPLTHARQATTPVLLYVNEGDLRCPPGQADELFCALRWAGREVEYVRYPGGSHLSIIPFTEPPSAAVDRLRRILRWLADHGGATPA